MIITFLGVNDKDIEFFKDKLEGHIIRLYKETISEVNIEDILDSEILCLNAFSKVFSNTLSKFNNLKLIATRSTGTDHIDLKYCNENKIVVKNVPLYGDNTIAEYAFALLLTLSRKIIKGSNRIAEGSFSREELQGFDLERKTIGIIGGGNIGMNVAKMAKGFCMNIIVFDIKQNEELQKELGFQYVTLEELYKTADIISLHVPLNTKTHHLINEDSINQMKQGVVLINTARGEVVDTTALLSAVEKGKLLAVGLDVFEGEDDFESIDVNSTDEEKRRNRENVDKLLTYGNVIITPHNAYNTIEAVNRINETTVKNINEFIKD